MKFIVIILAAVASGGCGPTKIEALEAENLRLQHQVDELQTQIYEIQEKATALETASDGLKEQVQRFQTENWRDVAR